MDPATLGGLALAFGAVIAAIFLEGASPLSVVLPAPMVLVFGGTIGAGIATMTLRDTLRAFKTLPHWVLFKAPSGQEVIDTLVPLTDRARREGLLALQEDVGEVDNPFLRQGLQDMIDQVDPEDLDEMLGAKIAAKSASDKAISKFFNQLGGYAPTIGIIGTVVSLVHVLENLSNPEELGHMIAAAFVATLWGLLSANLIWLPLGGRVARASQIEVAHMEVMREGLMLLQAGQSARALTARLQTMLDADEAGESS